MAFTRGSRGILWKGLGSPRDDILEPTVRAVQALPGQPFLDSLLQQFERVFVASHELQPARPYDHRIHLLPDTTPVAVRPYRYKQLQKDELERQCAEMLVQGIIRPSASPYAAPVLQVRKADKSWRFCIDYRALNT
jgi:hypothetical protein